MPRKRAFEDSDAAEASTSQPTPAKRLHSSPLRTPARQPLSTDFLFSTPYTPYSYSIPSDSPTNPFAPHRRAQKVDLPPATSFSKHLALRFQVVKAPELVAHHHAQAALRRKRARRQRVDPLAEDYTAQGIYRIVQVPLSYTLRHLHRLIYFLFDREADPAPAPAPRRRGDAPGYVFEVLKGVASFAAGYKPGHIKAGRTCAKLSSVRDPLYSESFLDLAQRAEDGVGALGEEDGENDEWSWENEDDFTVAHVWPEGGDLRRGIIYQHDQWTSIHITVSTQSVQSRKGVGNKPFVFRAFGTISLRGPSFRSPSPPRKKKAPEPSTRVLRSQKGLFRQTARRADEEEDLDATEDADEAGIDDEVPTDVEDDGDGDEDAAGDTEEDAAAEEEKWDGGLDTHQWNRTGAFERFLTQSAALGGSSPSPLRPDTPDGSEWDAASEADRSLSVYSSSSPFRLPLVTPAPALAATRFRVDRAQRRMARLVNKGMVYVQDEEEERDELEEGEGRVKRDPFADYDVPS